MTIKRPLILFGKTHKIETGYGNLYVTINEFEGKPIELFATIGKCGGSIMAKSESLGRLITLALKYDIPVKEITDQLQGISGEKPLATGNKLILSIPDAIGQLLKEQYGEAK